MPLKHKRIVFPEVDLSGDEPDPEWKGTSQFETVPIPGTTHRRWIRPANVCANAWHHCKEAWTEIVEDYEANPDDFYNAWHYLDNHPIYWKFDQSMKTNWPPNHFHRLEHSRGIPRCVDFMVVQVCPETMEIEDDSSKNTLTRVWYETGQFDILPREYEFGMIMQHHWHDYKLDGGAATIEEAVIALARKIWRKYGNDRRYAERTISQPKFNNAGEFEVDKDTPCKDGETS